MASSVNFQSKGLLKIIFLLHLILSSWGMQSSLAQIPSGYVYYNLIYMITLLWAIGSDGTDSVIMAFLVNVCILVLDVLTLSTSWPTWVLRREHLYFGFAIANAVVRPITAFLLYRIFLVRDVNGVGLRGFFADVLGDESSSNRQGYRDIDTPQASGDAPMA